MEMIKHHIIIKNYSLKKSFETKESLINGLVWKYQHTLELLRGIEYYKNEYDFKTGRGGCLNYGSPYKDDFPEETRKKVHDFVFKIQNLNKSELLENGNELEIKNEELSKEWHFLKDKLEQYEKEKFQKNLKYYRNESKYVAIWIWAFVMFWILFNYLLIKFC